MFFKKTEKPKKHSISAKKERIQRTAVKINLLPE